MSDQPPRRLSPLTPLVRSSLLVVAFLGTSWDDLLRGQFGFTALALLGALVLGGGYGVAAWLRTTYWVEADELRVDSGVLSRNSRRIRVDRVQGIDIVQPLVARAFGLAELRMDVLGGGRDEGSLAFLSLREAHRLRETLLERRDRQSDPVAAVDGPPPPRPPEPRREVARLDLGTLLVSMLLSFETVGFVVVGLGVATGLVLSGELWGAAGLLPVVVGFVLTSLRRLSAYYGFVVYETPRGVQVQRGLFERNSQTIALSRVQGVVVVEPLLWRRRRWARLEVSTVGTGPSGEGENGPSSSTVMPVAPLAHVHWLAARMLEGSLPPERTGFGQVELVAPPRRARWRSPVASRFSAVGLSEDLAVSRHGLLVRRTHVVAHARVQSVRLRQGPWQRWLRLADVVVDSPPGPVRVHARLRDEADARRLLELENALSRSARREPARPVRRVLS